MARNETAVGDAPPPLHEETRALLDTETAAHHLHLKPGTLRQWHALDRCPEGLKPVQIGGRLRWSTDNIRKLCGGAA